MVRRASYGVPAPNLLAVVTKGRTDGYIFGMIRNGRGLMPNYKRIEEMDRWDVVNYVRGLQGKRGRCRRHGAGGLSRRDRTDGPGYTQTAPTRPSPYLPRHKGAQADPGASADAPAPRSLPTQAPKPARRPRRQPSRTREAGDARVSVHVLAFPRAKRFCACTRRPHPAQPDSWGRARFAAIGWLVFLIGAFTGRTRSRLAGVSRQLAVLRHDSSAG